LDVDPEAQPFRRDRIWQKIRTLSDGRKFVPRERSIKLDSDRYRHGTLGIDRDFGDLLEVDSATGEVLERSVGNLNPSFITAIVRRRRVDISKINYEQWSPTNLEAWYRARSGRVATNQPSDARDDLRPLASFRCDQGIFGNGRLLFDSFPLQARKYQITETDNRQGDVNQHRWRTPSFFIGLCLFLGSYGLLFYSLDRFTESRFGGLPNRKWYLALLLFNWLGGSCGLALMMIGPRIF
jgi:hypothetical protein